MTLNAVLVTMQQSISYHGDVRSTFVTLKTRNLPGDEFSETRRPSDESKTKKHSDMENTLKLI